MSANPFSSDWLDGGRDERLRPHGTLSYVSGSTDEPLRFITLVAAARQDGVAPRLARRRDLRRREGLRLSWYDLKRKADELAAGLLALGLRRGNRVGIWAPNRHEWLVTQFATARVGLDPRQHQPGLSHDRARIRAQQGRLPRADHGAPLQEQRLPRHARRDRAGDPFQGRRARCSTASACPELKHVVLLGDEPVPPRCLSYRAGPRSRRPGAARAARCAVARRSTRTMRSTSSSRAAPPARRRARRCRTSTSSTTRATAPRRWRSARATGSASRCRCTTASAWCSACCAPPRPARRWCSPARGFDAGETLRSIAKHRCTALHGVPTMFAAMLERPRASRGTTCRRCAPASWPARLARSRPCAR